MLTEIICEFTSTLELQYYSAINRLCFPTVVIFSVLDINSFDFKTVFSVFNFDAIEQIRVRHRFISYGNIEFAINVLIFDHGGHGFQKHFVKQKFNFVKHKFNRMECASYVLQCKYTGDNMCIKFKTIV